MKKPASRILGTGSYASEKVLTNHDLEQMVDTSDEWIRTRTGIERRHILADGLSNSDQAAAAAQKALEAADLKARDIDCVLVATATPDHAFPSTACLVQAKIGAKKSAALDISAACSGFLYGLVTADAMISAGLFKHVLVIGSEVLSRFTDWEDRNTCVLFGDGAGAAVVGPAEGSDGLLSSFLSADGTLSELLIIPAGGSSHPPTCETVAAHEHFIHMEGREVFKHAVRTMTQAALEGVKRADLHPDDINLLITHQANIRIIDAVAKRLHLADERVFTNLQEYGNTSAASIPIGLDEALRGGRIQPGDNVLMVAFGSGFTWGSAVVRF